MNPYCLHSQNNIKSKIINKNLINLSTNKVETTDATTEIPTYLDRVKIAQMNRNQLLRKSQICRLIKKNYEDVFDIIEKL
jgi:hypothetical protein